MYEFLKEDIINVKSWFDVGDCNYEHDHKDETIPESGIVYCNIEHKITTYSKNITFKSINRSNLGDKYMNYFSKKFWVRRDEQHKYYLSLIKKKEFKGIDYYLTKFLLYLVK